MESVMALRAGGYDSEIHLFTDSSSPALNPTLLTYFIAGKIGREGLFPFSDDLCEKHGVTLHSGSRVTKLDALGKTVENSAGEKMSYDNCIVCSGASPAIPQKYKEYQDTTVFTIRSVDDAAELKKRISPGKKALVAGASMAGIKVVEALAQQGVEVTLTDTQKHVFPFAAYTKCAELIERLIEGSGVNLRLGAGSPDLYQYDIIVVCVGVKPNVDFIDKTQVDTDNGVLVDKFMRTNRAGLYAAGDCAQIRAGESGRITPGLWASARYMGSAAGNNVAGKNEACREVIRHNITRFFGVDFASIGDISQDENGQNDDGGGDVFEMESSGKYCRIAWKNGRVMGVNLLNMPEISGILKSHMQKSSDLSNLAMCKVFDKYPPIREAFSKR
jgi:NAD(P)H-nitrite reductase large subunit